MTLDLFGRGLGSQPAQLLWSWSWRRRPGLGLGIALQTISAQGETLAEPVVADWPGSLAQRRMLGGCDQRATGAKGGLGLTSQSRDQLARPFAFIIGVARQLSPADLEAGAQLLALLALARPGAAAA